MSKSVIFAAPKIANPEFEEKMKSDLKIPVATDSAPSAVKKNLPRYKDGFTGYLHLIYLFFVMVKCFKRRMPMYGVLDI